MGAEGGAGQAFIPVGVRAVFAFEPVCGAGGDLRVVGGPAGGVIAQDGGRRDERFGQGGAVPAALHQQRALAAGLDAELVGAVVHDR